MNALWGDDHVGNFLWRARPNALYLILFYASYVVAGWFSQGLAIIPNISVVFWPPAGIFAATLLLTQKRSWPWWVAIGCLAELTCNAIWFHSAIFPALFYFTANALTAMAAATLITRFTDGPFRFESAREIAALVILGACIAPLASATLIAATEVWLEKHPFWVVWPLVWLGDGSGLLIAMPLTLLIVQAWIDRSKIETPRLLGALGSAVILMVVSALAFQGMVPTLYLITPVFLWIAARYQFKGAAVALAAVTLMSAFFTSGKSGIFAGDASLLLQKVVGLQAFLAVSAIVSLIVASLAHQRALGNFGTPVTSARLELSFPIVAKISALLVVGLGVIVLLGWLFGIEALKSAGSGLATMKVNTALCFIAIGLSLAHYSRIKSDQQWDTWATVASLFALAVSLATLAEYVLGINSGIDELLFSDSASPLYPGRMSPATTGAFFAASLALLMPRLVADHFNAKSLMWGLVLTVAASALVGYAVNVKALYQIGVYNSMELHTAAGFAILAVGGLALTWPRKNMSDLMAVGAVREGASRYFFAAALVLFAAWLRYVLGELTGLTSPDVLFYTVIMLVALLAGWRAGLFATALSAFVANYYFVAPVGVLSLTLGEFTGLIIFALTGFAVSYLADEWMKLYGRTAEERDHLNKLVDERTTALIQSNKQLKLALSAANMTAWHYAPHTGVVTLSDDAAETLDLPTLDDIRIADDGYALIHPDDRENQRAKVDAALAAKGNYVNQYRHVRNGKAIWMEEHAQVVVDPDTQLTELIGITANITDRKSAEAALRESENFNRSVLQSSPDCIKVMSCDGAIEFINTNGQTQLDIDDLDSYIGKQWVSFWPEKIQETVESALAAAIRGSKTQFEALRSTMKGTPKWWDVVVSPILDVNGNCTRIISVSRDISLRKQIEKALQNSLDRLETAEYATSALNYDTRGGAVWRGPGLTRILGWEQDEVPATVEGWLDLLHPDDIAAAKTVELMRSNDGESRFGHEYRARHKDGHYVWLMDRGRKEYDAEGNLTGIVGASFDVTSRKLTEEALRKSEHSLAAVFEALPLGVALIDREGKLQIANDVFKRFAPEAIPSRDEKGHVLWEAHHQDGRRLERQDFPVARALRGEQAWPGQEMLYHGETSRGSIWTRVAAVPMYDKAGEILGATVVISDIDVEKRASEDLRKSEASFNRASKLARFGAYTFDVAKLHGTFSPSFWSMMGQQDVSEVLLENFMEFVHPDDRLRVKESMFAVLGKIGPYEAEYRLTNDREAEIWVMDRGETTGPLDQNSGLAAFASGMVLDITERKKNEQHQALLMNELNHRVKNTLATVQSMASQTLRTSPNLTEAKLRFEARLMALSKVHDVLTREKWESAPFADIVERAIGPYRGTGTDRFTVSGPDIRISAGRALAFAMTLHELCTNAVKYGALSNDKGKVGIVWSMSTPKKSEPVFKFRWNEKGGPAVTPPTKRGFGTKLIERSLASDLGGTVNMTFAKTGVTCSIVTKLNDASTEFETR